MAVPCGVGYYSGALSATCTVCPKGYYCGSTTTSATSLQTGGSLWSKSSDLSGGCFNGTYCGLGMTRSPDLLRDSCPAGFYCPVKTTSPLPCPGGTYSVSTGRSSLSDCVWTPQGYYSTQNSTSPNGRCSPGYYCPAQSTTPTEIPCPPRFYRPESGAGAVSDCSLCVSGGYCPIASVFPIVCPRGYFCLGGVSTYEPCLPGTYGNTTGLKSSDECITCTGGSYCNGFGLTYPRGLVDSGFYCLSGCNSSTPHSLSSNVSFSSTSKVTLRAYLTTTRVGGGNLGGMCPSGSYCPSGSILPLACNSGYYNSRIGGKDVSSCTACPPSFYCEGQGLSGVSGPCTAGYYCDTTASVPTQHITQPGYYTLTQASAMVPCSPGTYNSKYALSTPCPSCPSGFYCPNSTTISYDQHLCSKGHYCPLGTITPVPCDPGYFSNSKGNRQSSDCLSCTAGSYCGTQGEREREVVSVE